MARVAENEMCNYNFATEVEKSLKGCIMIELHGHEIGGKLQYGWAIILIHLQIINRYIFVLFDISLFTIMIAKYHISFCATTPLA